MRKRRRNRRIGALVAYGAGAAAVIFAVGLVLTVVQRRAEISIAAQTPPPVAAPEALPPEPAAPVEAVEAADGSLRGSPQPPEPQMAMARVAPPSVADRSSPPPRRATVRAAEPPVIRPPPRATAPSPLDEAEAPLTEVPSPQAPEATGGP